MNSRKEVSILYISGYTQRNNNNVS